MRPNSSGGPRYLSRSGKIVEAATVSVGKSSGAPARTVPVARGDSGAVLGDEPAGDAVIGAGARDVMLDDRDAGVSPARIAACNSSFPRYGLLPNSGVTGVLISIRMNRLHCRPRIENRQIAHHSDLLPGHRHRLSFITYRKGE